MSSDRVNEPRGLTFLLSIRREESYSGVVTHQVREHVTPFQAHRFSGRCREKAAAATAFQDMTMENGKMLFEVFGDILRRMFQHGFSLAP